MSSISKDPYTSVHILPLYSQLPTSEQLKIFDPTPPSARLIVLATNVAETSLTIPGIRYVFDTGRSKERKYALDTGVQSFEIDYISKASAQQRAGRAGRTGPGHCWRLYTSAVYEQYFPEHAEPEILRAPAESVVLQLKGFAYPRPIADFPFPTPPVAQTLNKAEQLLKNLGALTTTGAITDLGKQLSMYPLSPRLGKILAAGISQPELLYPILSLVAALAVPELFITESQLDSSTSDANTNQEDTPSNPSTHHSEHPSDKIKQDYGRARATLSSNDPSSDAIKQLTAVTSYLNAPSPSNQADVCQRLFLRHKALSETYQLRSQLEHLVRTNNRATITTDILSKSQRIKLSAKKITTQLNSVVASGYIDQIAIRHDRAPTPPEVAMKPRRAIDVPYLPLIPLHDHANATLLEKAVFIHPSSVLARASVRELPEYICYSHLQRSQSHTIIPVGGNMDAESARGIPKTRMFPLCPVTAAQLSHLAQNTALIVYGKPLPKSQIKEIPGRPKRRECWVSVELHGAQGKGALGWPLPPVKVRQVVDVKSREGWRVEKVLS